LEKSGNEFLPISTQLLLGEIAKEDFGENNKKITIFISTPIYIIIQLSTNLTTMTYL
jgi:hypothetical protein